MSDIELTVWTPSHTYLYPSQHTSDIELTVWMPSHTYLYPSQHTSELHLPTSLSPAPSALSCASVYLPTTSCTHAQHSSSAHHPVYHLQQLASDAGEFSLIQSSLEASARGMNAQINKMSYILIHLEMLAWLIVPKRLSVQRGMIPLSKSIPPF